MIKRFTFLFSSLIFVVAVNAQQVRVFGFVKDESTGAAIFNASFFSNDVLLCTSDSVGYFSCLLENGKYAVSIRCQRI